MSASSASADFLAAERDAKFKKWLQNKTLRDKALEYLGKLDVARAESEESLRDVAVSLCAIDRLLGTDEGGGGRGGDHDENDGGNAQEVAGGKKNDSGPPAQKSMRSAWFKWTTEHHSYSNVKLTASDVAGLSGGIKEYLDEDKETGTFTLPSLKYFFPQVPKQGEKAKPLTNDQKQQNMIFGRETRKVWIEAQTLMTEQVRMLMENKGDVSARSGGAGAEAERKSKAAGDSRGSDAKASGGEGGDGDGGGGKGGGARSELKALNDLSLKRMREWIEEDEDKETKRQAEKQKKNLTRPKRCTNSLRKRRRASKRSASNRNARLEIAKRQSKRGKQKREPRSMPRRLLKTGWCKRRCANRPSNASHCRLHQRRLPLLLLFPVMLAPATANY